MNFVDYLASLPAVKLDKLYDSLWTSQAVFRSLPPLAKQYVLRLLYIEEPVLVADVATWAKADASSKHRAAIDRLQQLRVLLDRKDKLYLNPPMQKQLRRALSSGGGPPREEAELPSPTSLPSADDLVSYSKKQWEAVILQLLASGSGGASTLSPIIEKAFVKGGLLTEAREDASRITEQGFRFLLLDTSSQMWQIIREYVSAAEAQGMDTANLIGFMLELGFHTVGKAYTMKGLLELHHRMVEDLAVLGLLYIVKTKKEKLYIPTRLAASLSASLSESTGWHPEEGHIMVETNYRVYAYTMSRLQAEVMGLFVRIEYRLPNLVVGAVTRESVSAAFANGISAEEIISYLQKHAHPHVAQRTPVLPITVADQIRLWEADRKRVLMRPAVLYDEFPPDRTLYNLSVQYARDNGILLWEQTIQKRFAVGLEHHDTMKAFIRQAMKGGN